MSFHDSDELGTSFNVDNIDITILLSPQNDLTPKDSVVLIHCDKGFNGSLPSANSTWEYNGLALECKGEFGLALSNDGKDIIATLSSKEVNARAEAKSYSEAVSGALVFENQGGDIIA
ncbi:MAG: hypothetical protein LBD61_00010, partial [Endomicrobium sp.]|nr:hypothetical protein [Endomicrobium sp.]